MTQDTLNALIALGEGFTSEFKRSGTSDLGRELCAFANATGGVVLIGVADDGTIHGVKDHNKLKSAVQSLARSVDPPLIVEVESIGDVLAVSVPAQNSKPYSFAGKFYLREGASSQQLSRNEIREFFFQEGVIHFDETPCIRFSLEEDLTDTVWKGFSKRASIPAGMEPLSTLQNLGLLRGKTMTHAGAWLLAENIQKFSLRAHVSCALFQGKTNVYILDRKDFTADLCTVCRDVVSYVVSKLNTEFIIKPQITREERPELPVDALREAIVNAVAHRDYRSTANVQVHIYRDRVEVINPGGLPAGMTVEELGIKSVPRNPLLFGIFYRMDMVEQIGTGIKRIRDLCRDYGVPEPQIRPQEHWMNVVFPRDPVKAGLMDEEQRDLALRPESGPESGPESELAGRIIRALKSGAMKRSELARALGHDGVSGALKRTIKALMEKSLIEYTIPEKPSSRLQQYRLTKKGRSLLEAMKDQ